MAARTLLCALGSAAALCAATLELPEVQVGLGGIVRYGHPPFANAMYNNPDWKDDASGATIVPPQLSAQGYPLYMLTGQVLRAMPLYDTDRVNQTNLLSGRFALTWQGEADIRMATPSLHVGGSNATGLVVNGLREYTSQGYGNGNRFRVYMYAVNSNNPPRAIRLWMPNPDNTNQTLRPAADSPNPAFHPRYLDVVRPFKLLRFMDWLATNNSTRKDWRDRRSPLDGTMQGGAAYEFCVAICNQIQADLWLCVPHMATDEHLTNLARLILFGSDGTNAYTAPVASPVFPPLATNLRVFVEYSNEIWNPGFSQWGWVDTQRKTQGVSFVQCAGRHIAGMWRIFAGVWGAESNRIVRVGAGRASDPSYTRSLLGEMITNGMPAHIYSITTYSGAGMSEWVVAHGADFFAARTPANLQQTHDEWLRRYLSGVVANNGMGDAEGAGVDLAHRNNALALGLPLVSYEGGPSTYTDWFDTPSNQPTGGWATTFWCDAVRQPQMAENYAVEYNLCKMRGQRTFAAFVDVSNWGKYGQWGHKEWLTQSTATYAFGNANKYKAILDQASIFGRIRHIDEPQGAVPSFTTPNVLPHAWAGQPYQFDIQFGGGDGALTCAYIGGVLPPGIAVARLGTANVVRVSGVCMDPSTYPFMLRITDADGDPAWQVCSAKVQRRAEQPEQVIDFQDLAPNIDLSNYYCPQGFFFTNRLSTVGAAQGYATVMLRNRAWGGDVTMTKRDGGTFDLTSFEYASHGADGSLNVVATFESSGTVTTNLPHGTVKTNNAFYADWIGLTKIVFTGFNTNDQKRFATIDNLRISGVLDILTTALPGGTATTPYNQTLRRAGGLGTCTWTVASGVLPTGMVLTSSGVLQGTPLVPGTNSFGLSVADEAMKSDAQDLTLIIAVPEPAMIALFLVGCATRATTHPHIARREVQRAAPVV